RIEALVAQVVAEVSAAPDQTMSGPVDPDLWRCRVAEEAEGTCRSRVRSRLENANQVADLCLRKTYAAGQYVQWCAQGADHVDNFRGRNIEPTKQCNGIVALNGLPEIA